MTELREYTILFLLRQTGSDERIDKAVTVQAADDRQALRRAPFAIRAKWGQAADFKITGLCLDVEKKAAHV